MSQALVTPDTEAARAAARVAALAAAATVKLCAGAAITAAELGALVGLDERTVQRQAREGRYPSQQPTGPGGARRFSPADVKAIQAAVARPARVSAA